LAPQARAQRWIALAGGRDAVLQNIQACETRAVAPETARNEALDEYRWIAELAGQLIRVDAGDVQARQTKARALRLLGLSTLNTNWRHWYLSSALELEGRYDRVPFKGNGLAARDIWMSVDPTQLLRNLGVRLQAERCLDLHLRLKLAFTDRPLTAVLELRRGVLEIGMQSQDIPNDLPSLHLRTAWPTWLRQMALGWPDLSHLLMQGEIQLIEGNAEQLLAFVDCFEKPAERMPLLATR
jgi:alkyl sulfatase BDS1-like metallo-beta-lactamase superfamily hydrolase